MSAKSHDRYMRFLYVFVLVSSGAVILSVPVVLHFLIGGAR